MSAIDNTYIGSPPHTRGILGTAYLKSMLLGITPAYAGNTKCYGVNLPRVRDHPRIRGEYVVKIGICNKSTGSPPHTRGIQITIDLIYAVSRITPAYAGNTTNQIYPFSLSKDHPRIRGEYF